ncbi:unnamed protein product, partial [Mycena citricolor]
FGPFTTRECVQRGYRFCLWRRLAYLKHHCKTRSFADRAQLNRSHRFRISTQLMQPQGMLYVILVFLTSIRKNGSSKAAGLKLR